MIIIHKMSPLSCIIIISILGETTTIVTGFILLFVIMGSCGSLLLFIIIIFSIKKIHTRID